MDDAPMGTVRAAAYIGRTLGWALNLLHVAAVVASTVLFADLMLLRFSKIPFTCSAQFDMKQLLVQMLGLLFGALVFVPALAGLEGWMLEQPFRFFGLALALALVSLVLARALPAAADGCR